MSIPSLSPAWIWYADDDVNVLSVNITMNRGKVKRVGQNYSRSKDKKKASVTLIPGDRIEIFEGA